ncbi:MAG: endonuclease/exonuclease/phosphatase family protein [Phocaeicola sp.]
MKQLLLSLLILTCALQSFYAQSTIEPREENSTRIMLYNVRNGIGMDQVRDYDRLAEVINRVSPDVVAMQELDSAALRTDTHYVLEEFSKRTQMFPTYGAAIEFDGGKYGVGILSKEKPLKHYTVTLPGREEARILLIAEFETYLLACTHFSLTEEDQQLSIPILVKALANSSKPVFFAGDMNSVPDSPIQKEINKHFTTLNNTKEPTYPADSASVCIDYIYAFNQGDNYTLLKRHVIPSVASDHLPLFVDIRFKAKSTHIMRTKPYLQNPIGNGMTISWFTNVPVHSWIEYGTTPELGSRKELLVDGQVICNNKHHKIRLTDLKPGETYYYRVASREITLYQAYKKEFGKTSYSETYSFTLPSEQQTDFKALIFNDLHKNNSVLEMLMEQVKDKNYDFVLFNGDCIDDPKNEDEALHFLTAMNERVGAENTPVFYIRGNHEIRNAYSIELRDLFDYVDDKTYNAFSWGDTRFVVLDCGEDKPDSTWVYYHLNNFSQLRQDQVTFLKNEVASKPFKKAKKRVLVHHIPLYGTEVDRYLPCLDLWGDILAKAPFHIGIHAHTHKFEYLPKGSSNNHFPSIIGGGNRVSNATVMVLEKTGNKLMITALDTTGNVLKEVEL